MTAKEGGRHLTGEVATASASGDPAQSPTQSSAAASSNSPAPAPTWKGRLIKRFKLVDELGEGAMGRVFVAEDTILRRHVALKLLPSKHRDGRPNHRTERLITEARSAATLEHPSVVTIYEIDQSGGVHYIAMELVEGGNLERLVQMSGPMEVERACQLVAEAAEALAHAHSRGIVHRDVKPANLLLTRSGRCKVCDFGLAMIESPEGDPTKLRCVGTPYFIAPEIAQGKGATELSDIYSLGCTLFFLLTGRPPFPGTNSRQVLKLHIGEPLPDLRRWRSDAPDRLIATLEQACAKNPTDRFNNAERFAKILRTFTITPGNAQAAGGMMPVIQNAAYPSPPVAGSSAHMMPVNAPSASAMQAALPASNSQNLAPHASFSQPPNVSANQPADFQQPGRHLGSPLIWAGGGIVLTAGLIALGTWLVRTPASNTTQAIAPAPTAAVVPAAPTAAPAVQPAVSSLIATPAAPASVSTPKPVVAAAVVRPTATPVVALPNIVTNGNLEEAGSDGPLAGWTIHERFKDHVQLLRENGNRFLRLRNDDFSQTVFVDQKIAIDPTWKAITVSARMRAFGFREGKLPGQDARVRFVFRDQADQRIDVSPPVPSIRADSAWVHRVVTTDVPKGAKTLYIQLAIFNATGTADFDNISVVPKK